MVLQLALNDPSARNELWTPAQIYDTSSRSTELIIQKRDGSLVEEPYSTHNPDHQDRYYAEIAPNGLDEQASLVERIISMAFDVLGARHLEVRVRSNKEAA